MKSKNEMKTEIKEKGDQFFRDTSQKLRRSNPYLHEFMRNAVKTAKTKEFIHVDIVRLALVALCAMGATDENDPDFVKVSKETIEEIGGQSFQYDFVFDSPIREAELIAYVNRKINPKNKITCEDALEKIKKLITAIYLEKENKDRLPKNNKQNHRTRVVVFIL